jgi:hypothetical protein
MEQLQTFDSHASPSHPPWAFFLRVGIDLHVTNWHLCFRRFSLTSQKQISPDQLFMLMDFGWQVLSYVAPTLWHSAGTLSRKILWRVKIGPGFLGMWWEGKGKPEPILSQNWHERLRSLPPSQTESNCTC